MAAIAVALASSGDNSATWTTGAISAADTLTFATLAATLPASRIKTLLSGAYASSAAVVAAFAAVGATIDFTSDVATAVSDPPFTANGSGFTAVATSIATAAGALKISLSYSQSA
jgi:hypothetical protein